MMLLSKIISGGQTGVDRGAIEAAFELGFPYGGLIPKGRLAEDGIVPEKFDKMEVATRKDYLFRTEWNVTHSDATLIIARREWNGKEWVEELKGGTLRTLQFAETHCKPCLVLFMADVQKTIDWLNTLGRDEIVLNVAGPRESKCDGIQLKAKNFVRKVLRRQLPLGAKTLAECRRLHTIEQLAKKDSVLFSFEELKSGVREMRRVAAAYRAKFPDSYIPEWQRDVDDIEMQTLKGVPFGTELKDQCQLCRQTSLFEDFNGRLITYCRSNNICPDRDGSLDAAKRPTSLWEAKFASTKRYFEQKREEAGFAEYRKWNDKLKILDQLFEAFCEARYL